MLVTTDTDEGSSDIYGLAGGSNRTLTWADLRPLEQALVENEPSGLDEFTAIAKENSG